MSHALLTKWCLYLTKFCSQHAWWIVCLYLLAAGLVLYYTLTHLTFHTDTEDMIAEHLDWRQDYIQYKNAFPLNHKTIVVLIEGQSRAQVNIASKQLYNALKDDKDNLFVSVHNFSLEPFFDKTKLLYLDEETLANIQEQLPSLRPLYNIEYDELPRFLKVLQGSLSNPQALAQFKPIYADLAKAISYNLEGKAYFIPWQKMFAKTNTGNPIQVIEIKPNIDYQTLLPGQAQVDKVKAIFKALELKEIYGVDLKLTGEIPLNLEELASVSQGAGLAALIAFIMVAILLLISFRAISLVCIGLLTLIVGLLMTAGFATLAIGHLNMISVAFAVLYIGLSIDFTIHLIMRFKECHINNDENPILTTMTHLGPALLFCALTTSMAFYAFLPTSFKGVAELGAIAGSGMLISFIINLSFLPALLSMVNSSQFSRPVVKQTTNHKPLFFYPKTIIIVFIALILGAIIALPKIQFNADPMDLRDPNQPSVKVYYDLSEKLDFPPGSVTFLNAKDNPNKHIQSELEHLDSVKHVLTLASFVPKAQQEKLKRIKQIRDTLPAKPKNQNNHTNLKQSIDGFKALADKIIQLDSPPIELVNLKQSIDIFLDHIKNLPDVVGTIHVQAISHSALLGLSHFFNVIHHATQQTPFTQDDLPEALVQRWQTNAFERVEIYPAHDMKIDENQARFVKDVLLIAPKATGLPIIHEKAGKAVVEAFIEAFLLALLAITILLIILMRNLKQIILTLVPLLSASVLTGGMSYYLGLEFNFANIIALPLLLGIGIDNGIHLVHRFYAHHEDHNLLQTSTAKAVIASTLTTLLSFANLSFSQHLGMSSMGQMLTLGMLITLVCTLVFLPALLHLINGKK